MGPGWGKVNESCIIFLKKTCQECLFRKINAIPGNIVNEIVRRVNPFVNSISCFFYADFSGKLSLKNRISVLRNNSMMFLPMQIHLLSANRRKKHRALCWLYIFIILHISFADYQYLG